MSNWLDIVDRANEAKKKLPLASSKNRVLAMEAMSKALIDNCDYILEQNKIDLENAVNITPVMKKRLSLTKEKLISIAEDVISVSKLPDPTNQTLEEFTRPNGLKIKKVSQPFGVILTIFESRPNVCVDIASLSIKTANVCVLRGGKEAKNTNKALVDTIRNAIKDYIPEDSVNVLLDTTHDDVEQMLMMKDKFDLCVPRGSKGLINHVVNTSLVPVIETGAGVCHVFIDESADLNMAYDILLNGKTSNPAVCNATESLLIHKNISDKVLQLLKEKKFDTIVSVHGDENIKKYLNASPVESFDTEFDDLCINIKIVSSIDEAIEHISKYGTKHSEVIVTNDDNNALKFMNEIDAACVYHNASSRFTDGGCFGFGAELGISTGKLHARGPMGLKEMMTYKYLISGNGQIRK
ncbi:MAG: glutamate-5-semialdehyde dehydrogenase [Acholeplasmatales bacterium]|nr:glutamate-5-semialdehyde dehydrogenase [Acholeplasmatales bacterium]